MNEIGMTKKDVEKRIKQEEKYLVNCQVRILDINSDIRATKRAIKFWKSYLKKMEKNGVK